MKKKIVKITVNAVLILFGLVTIYPFVWMVFSSFKKNSEILALHQQLLPKEFIFDNYINMIETTIRTPCKGLVNKVLKIGCRHLFGFVPEVLDFEYPSLKQTTEKENIEIKAGKINMIVGLQQAGIISSKTAVELVNREKLFSMELDPNEAVELKDFADQTEDSDVGVMSRSTGGKYVRPY